MKDLNNVKTYREDSEITINEILNLCPENKEEYDFLNIIIHKVKQEFMNEVTKRMENLAYFERVEINLKK